LSVPTFNGVSLLTDSETQADTAPVARASLADMPGVNGSYVQQAGLGAKQITIEGFLEASSTTYALAMTALRAAIATVRAQVGSLPATLVDCSAASVANCLLQEYKQAGRFLLGMRDTAFVARVEVQALILQLDTDP
jgi:hypothetical protein